LKKQKQQRINENASMSEEAKLCHVDEAIITIVYKSGKKFVVREKKGSVKMLELDSNNRDVDRDSSDESDINELSDSMRPFEILSMHS